MLHEPAPFMTKVLLHMLLLLPLPLPPPW